MAAIVAAMARLSKLSRSIEGKVAIITGAASGMGRATAYVFADEGARLALVDRNADGVETVAKEVRDAGGDARAYGVDLADGDAIIAVVESVQSDLGPIDILVNNAGISVGMPIDHDAWEKAWAMTFAVNLTAQARLIRACAADLARNNEGRVVNIASTEGLGATAGGSPYTAAKHGVIGLTRAAALDYAAQNLRVNAVCPGYIDTPMMNRFTGGTAEGRARVIAEEPVGRMGKPEEIAAAVVWLCSDAAAFVVGHAMVIDGGQTV